MQYISGLKTYHDSNKSAVTLGKFDGLHRGHEKLIETVEKLGKEKGVKSIVCAFDMQPLFKKRGVTKQFLMTKEERKSRLKERVDCLVDCPFTDEFSQIEAEEFIKNILIGVFHAAYVVVGSDFRFGHDTRGDIHMLKEYEKTYGYQLIVIEKEKYLDREISSTYVKEAVNQGEMELAQKLLGYSYEASGIVEPGKKLGRKLGFPTLNVAPAPEKLMPPFGVYTVKVKVDGNWYTGIGNVGIKPTVSNEERVLIESFLFDYAGDAYGKMVEIRFYSFRRKEQKFSSIEELKACIDQDIEYGKKYFEKEQAS